jgi:acetyl esterase/lipase
MYSLIAQPFLRAEKSVAIVGYRTYPTTDVDGQVNDLERAMDCLRREYPAVNDITLVGHSSGAHISMLGLLSGKLTVDRFVGLSGVYDIAAHYCFERGRGVERISPLAPACGGSLETWRRNSPTQLVATASDSLDGLPPMLICHGGLDTTVPYSSSVNFVNAVHCVSNSLRQTCSLLILPDVEHADTAMHLMFGGETQEAVMDWVAQQTATTSNA